MPDIDVVEVVVDPPVVVEVTAPQSQILIEVATPGPQGPPGPPGPAGVAYTHVQSSLSSVWTINHNLGFRPTVSILSVGGVEIEATVSHTSNNQVIVSFVVATAGTARLI